MLDKTFDPAAAEPRLYERWERSGAFQPTDDPAAEPFSIVIPPPNVTGSLHIGHALNNTLQDVLTRFERMRGKAALWLPGTDHAGIATQMVVERQLAAKGNEGRRELGRDKFVERVWAWKAESGGTIERQLRRLGASCDWSRERFTLDEGLSAAVRKVFVRLYKEGLIYRDKRLVNWDPQFQTAISNLEVETRETPGKMWHFAYPLEGEPIDGVGEIVIATTRRRPCSATARSRCTPDDERYKKFVGRMVRLPIADRLIPIIADEYPDPEKGSGAVKITGAHDFNDYEVAVRHGLSLISIMDEKARMTGPIPERYVGQDRYVARKMVLADIEAMGLYRGAEDRVIPTPFGDRSGVVIEPFLTDQWYVNAGELAKEAIAAVEDGRTVFEPRSWEKTYFEWMRNIQPWCVSRQLWWGHRIPAWYDDEGRSTSRRRRRRRAPRPGTSRCGRTRTCWTPGSARGCGRSRRWGGRRDRRPEAVLSDAHPRHRLRHHLLLGRADDDDGAAPDGRGPVQARLHQRPDPRRQRRQDEQVQGQRHGPLGARRRVRRRRPALHPGRHVGAGEGHQAQPPAHRRLP
jgi:valyl-tRNA synthetase